MHDSVENIVDGDAGLVSRLCALLIDTCLDEDGIPVIVGLLVDGVGTANVTLRSVTDEVNGLWGSNQAVLSVAPLAHETGSKLKCRHLGLAKGVGMELTLASSEVLESDLKHAAKSAHAETDVLVSGGPDNIVVGEVEWRALIESLRASAKNTALGHGNIKHDLNVTSPIAGVGKDKDGVNRNIVEVALTAVGMLLRSELAERSSGRIVLNDVSRGDNILEAIAFSDKTALLALAANDKNGAVLLSHFPHRGMAADELTRLNILIKLLGKIAAALFFSLTTTVGEEDVRSEKETVLVAELPKWESPTHGRPRKSHDNFVWVIFLLLGPRSGGGPTMNGVLEKGATYT